MSGATDLLHSCGAVTAVITAVSVELFDGANEKVSTVSG